LKIICNTAYALTGNTYIGAAKHFEIKLAGMFPDRKKSQKHITKLFNCNLNRVSEIRQTQHNMLYTI
jgi:hypothetical protein